MLTRLGQTLESPVKYELIVRNPARGVRLKPVRAAPVWLESAEQIAALLDAAGELDRGVKSNAQVPRLAILSALVLTGMRIGELIELRWRDVDLAGRTITVRESKTDAARCDERLERQDAHPRQGGRASERAPGGCRREPAAGGFDPAQSSGTPTRR